MVAVGFIAGCTAIIDGAGEWSASDTTVPQDDRPERGDALVNVGGNEVVVVPGEGSASEATGGRFTADGGSPSGFGGAEGGRPASEAGGASAGESTTPNGQAGASGGDGSAGQATDVGCAAVGGAPAAGGSGSSSGEVGGAPAVLVGDPAKGHQILILDNCYRCHGDNLAGRSFYPNITPDIETGIGAWTDQQIATAVRGAIGPDGELFCAVMPLYSGFKPQEVADLIAFLRIVPAVNNSIVAVCPGHNP